EENGKKKRRRRRRKKSQLPKMAAFSSPVLKQGENGARPGNGSPATGDEVRKRKAAPAGPLVEYVRGPLRINMAPVASAKPSDVAKRQGGKPKRRNGRKPFRAPDINSGSVVATASAAGEPRHGG